MAAALLLVLMASTTCPGVGALSLGRLFPASRRGVRGSLLSSFANKMASNSLKEVVRQAAVKQPSTKQEVVKQTKLRQETLQHEVKEETFTETKDKVKVQHPVTDSPIYYIRLPPSPYVYMPGLGYISPNTNHLSFLRPDIPFITNGKPSSVFHFKAPPRPTHPPKTTTTTTTTTTPRPVTTSKPQKPTPTKKPSPITWLPGSWIFNGRPSNLFIFNSPYNPHPYDKLHQTYSKPGVYV